MYSSNVWLDTPTIEHAANLAPHLSHAERKAYRDAANIVDPGAVNVAGIANAIAETVTALRREDRLNAAAIDRHPAVRAMVGQLAYLTGEGLGSDQTAHVIAVRHAMDVQADDVTA
jgi:hypothetical protein